MKLYFLHEKMHLLQRVTYKRKYTLEIIEAKHGFLFTLPIFRFWVLCWFVLSYQHNKLDLNLELEQYKQRDN